MSTSLELLPAGEARETGTAARIAAAASKEVTVPVTLLGNYLWTLAAVAETGRRLTRSELDACRQRGVDAATGGVGLRALVDLHLTATWRAWEELPAAQTATRLSVLRAVARSVLRAADDAVAALADGYEHAQRLAIRQEEAMRREFIDDLLGGGGDLELLVARAERFGLRLASHHVVAVATAGPNQLPLTEASSLTRRAEAEIAHRFSSRDVLVATKADCWSASSLRSRAWSTSCPACSTAWPACGLAWAARMPARWESPTPTRRHATRSIWRPGWAWRTRWWKRPACSCTECCSATQGRSPSLSKTCSGRSTGPEAAPGHCSTP